MRTNHVRTIIEAAQAMERPSDPAAVIQEIVVQAPRLLPAFEHVCVSVIEPPGELETLAASTILAAQFDALQRKTHEGPCLDAALEDDTVIIKHAPHEQRWPDYTRLALDLGLRSQIGVRLYGQAKRLVGLNLYSTSHQEFDPGSVGVAEHFAVHAGIALGHVREGDQLRTAIGTRTVIGTAVGIVMERYGASREQAFAYLVRQASTANRKLREIAGDLVDETEGKSGGESGRDAS